MTDPATRARLLALQHGDSFFPGGGFAFSQGLEGLAALEGKPGSDRIASFLRALVVTRWSGFDRVALVRAHRAETLDAVVALDTGIEAASIVESLRTGSRRQGGALLAAHDRLGTPDAAAYRALVADLAAPGHLAAVQGLLWRRLGIAEAEAVAMSGYGLVAGIVSAAIRLNLLGAIDGQRLIAATLDEIASLAAEPIADDQPLAAFAVHAEIAAMRQARAATRFFSN